MQTSLKAPIHRSHSEEEVIISRGKIILMHRENLPLCVEADSTGARHAVSLNDKVEKLLSSPATVCGPFVSPSTNKYATKLSSNYIDLFEVTYNN